MTPAPREKNQCTCWEGSPGRSHPAEATSETKGSCWPRVCWVTGLAPVSTPSCLGWGSGGAPFCLSSHQRRGHWFWQQRTPLFLLTFPRTWGPGVAGQDLFFFSLSVHLSPSVSPTLQLFSTELCLSFGEVSSEGKKRGLSRGCLEHSRVV